MAAISLDGKNQNGWNDFNSVIPFALFNLSPNFLLFEGEHLLVSRLNKLDCIFVSISLSLSHLNIIHVSRFPVFPIVASSVVDRSEESIEVKTIICIARVAIG